MSSNDLNPRCLTADAPRPLDDHSLAPVSPYRGGRP
jgi:hypothetical protein